MSLIEKLHRKKQRNLLRLLLPQQKVLLIEIRDLLTTHNQSTIAKVKITDDILALEINKDKS